MLWPGIGCARPSLPNLPMRGPRIRAPARPRERALVVDDRRAGEVLHADAAGERPLEEPAVRAPDPVGDDRVRDREPDAEGEIDPELGPLGHRAPDDRERDAGEDDLEQVARRRPGISENQSNGALPTAVSSVTDGKKPCVPIEEAAVAEGDAEADRPVDDRADPEDQHVLAGDVAGVLHPRQARLEEREARLHEHDEDGRDDHPDGAGCDEQVVLGHCFPFPCCRFGPTKKPAGLESPTGINARPCAATDAATTCGQCCGPAGRAQLLRSVSSGFGACGGARRFDRCRNAHARCSAR